MRTPHTRLNYPPLYALSDTKYIPNQDEKYIIVFYPIFFPMKWNILRLEKVYDRNFLLIYISIVEQTDYAVSVKDEAFNVISQFDETNNWEATDK